MGKFTGKFYGLKNVYVEFWEIQVGEWSESSQMGVNGSLGSLGKDGMKILNHPCV